MHEGKTKALPVKYPGALEPPPKIMCAAKTDNLATVQIFVEKLANLKYNVLTNILIFQYSYIILEAFSTRTALSWTYFEITIYPMGQQHR